MLTAPYRLSPLTAPSSEPLTLTQLKSYLRITADVEDTLLTEIIKIARQICEQYTGQAFITQSWEMWLDHFPCQQVPFVPGYYQAPVTYLTQPLRLEIPLYPLQSVESITTYASDDTPSVLSSDTYQVATYTGMRANYGRIALRSGYTWPIPGRPLDGVRIEFICGYGDNETDVPSAIRRALLEECAYRYSYRGDCDGENIMNVRARELLSMFRRGLFR